MSSTNLDQAVRDAVTVVGEGKFRITWKFEEFSVTNKTSNQTSPTFGLSTKKDLIELCLGANSQSFFNRFKTNYFFVIIIFGGIKKNISLLCKMSLIDSAGNRRFIQECTFSHNAPSGAFNINRDYVFDSNSGLLNNDTLIVYCEVDILNDQTLLSPNYQQQAVTSKVLQDYDSLLESAKFSDVLLVVGKGRTKKELHVHKNILSTRSPFFGAMFDYKDTKEANENRVAITDVSPDVFDQFIRFVYTGKVNEMDKYVADLLIVADKYQTDCLKSLCSHYLSSELTIESVASVLVLADLHSASELKSKCIDYIVGHTDEVMATEDWKLIKHKPDLMEHLFQSLSKKLKKQ